MNDWEEIGRLFSQFISSIFARFPRAARGIYLGTGLLCFLHSVWIAQMAWWSALIFSLFLTLIFATALIVILHLGLKVAYWLSVRRKP